MRTILTFRDALTRVQDVGILGELRQLRETVFAGKIKTFVSPVTCARIAAFHLNGQLCPLRGRGGLSHIVGSKQVGTLVDPRNVPNILEAQGIAESILGDAWKETWSIGAMARQLLRWVRPGKSGETYHNDSERIIHGSPYGYHECKPGRYDYAEYHDVSGYYQTMMERLRSLYVYCGRDNKLTWFDTPTDEWERWQTLMREVGRCKPLRNMIAGNMAGSMPTEDAARPIMVWYSEKHKKVVTMPIAHEWGRFRSVGLLVVRSGAELTEMSCEQIGNDAVYSNVDCVHTIGAVPTIWGDFGFRTKLVAQGPADIKHRGCYKVGYRQTLTYKTHERMEIPVPRERIPGRSMAAQWLFNPAS